MIMEEHGSSLLKLTYSYVKNWSTAEDIVQETFINFSQKYNQYRGESSLKTWLFQIAVNKSKDFLKSPKNKLSHLGISMVNLYSKEKNADEKLIEMDEYQIIAKCLFKLPIKYREVLTLFYYEDLTIAEISRILSINESNVRTRLSRGREKFKKIYLKEVEEIEGKVRQTKDSIG
ncbi:hypothetical protein BC6307_06385 [Sutcliffiella cohnii]|uniref:RNA polymerase subunit sigma n=2 Tax=Bacillaceae TaxID=186817 RepID=A0A223KXV1_9BACI|nr:hypothetical protein BC6307_06385 [Sutcliffiella cohnii]